MVVSITAALVAAGVPEPVQIVVSGVPAGAGYVVTGRTASGDRWGVPGGVGVSTGSQVVLVDNRGALNTPITYGVVSGGVTLEAPPVTVTFAGRAVIQSLDGQTVVEFVWLDDGLPREPEVRSRTFAVPGRRRPVVVVETGGDGGGELTIRTTQDQTDALAELVAAGRPVVLRTDGAARDLPAVDLIHLTKTPNILWRGDGGLSTQRVWSLGYVLADDPEPGTAVSAYTWIDFDEVMAARTWNEFDAIFAASTWDGFDTYDWGQLA